MVGYDLPYTASELQGSLVWHEDWDCYICEMSDDKENTDVTRESIDKELEQIEAEMSHLGSLSNLEDGNRTPSESPASEDEGFDIPKRNKKWLTRAFKKVNENQEKIDSMMKVTSESQKMSAKMCQDRCCEGLFKFGPPRPPTTTIPVPPLPPLAPAFAGR